MLQSVLLVTHILVAIALIAVILIQRSEGGGLGIGGGGGGMGGFMTARGTANLLTRVTAILAAVFMALSLTLAFLGTSPSERGSIVDNLAPSSPLPSVPAPAAPPTGEPAAPAEPPAPAAPAAPAAPIR